MENYDNILCKNHNTGLILHGFLLLFYSIEFIKKFFIKLICIVLFLLTQLHIVVDSRDWL